MFYINSTENSQWFVHREVSNHRRSRYNGQRSRQLRPQLLHGETDMLARTIGITRAEDLPDCNHTVWQIKEPATDKQSTWLLLVRLPRNCQTRPHCGSLTMAELAVVGMLYCGVSLYRVAAGYEDTQGVENSVSSCSRE